MKFIEVVEDKSLLNVLIPIDSIICITELKGKALIEIRSANPMNSSGILCKDSYRSIIDKLSVLSV